MKRFFRTMMLVLTLLLVALISALTAMRFAIHGREVRVPNLAGQMPQRAEGLLAEQGLLLETGDRYYSDTISDGGIVSQSPAPGTIVRRGWRVEVALSLGPAREVVPNVVGESGRAGQINVQRRGLEVGTVAVAHLPGLPPDQVVAESPPPESKGMISPKVSLLITAPEDDQSFVMPDLSGRPLAEAARAVTDAGLKLGNFPVTTSLGPPQPMIPEGMAAERVTAQTPAAGQKVTPGTVVTLQTAQSQPPPSPQPSAPAPSPAAQTPSQPAAGAPH